jgi:hypothetical protein
MVPQRHSQPRTVNTDSGFSGEFEIFFDSLTENLRLPPGRFLPAGMIHPGRSIPTAYVTRPAWPAPRGPTIPQLA